MCLRSFNNLLSIIQFCQNLRIHTISVILQQVTYLTILPEFLLSKFDIQVRSYKKLVNWHTMSTSFQLYQSVSYVPIAIVFRTVHATAYTIFVYIIPFHFFWFSLKILAI